MSVSSAAYARATRIRLTLTFFLRGLAPPKKAQTHTSISLTKSDVQTLKDIQQDLRARTDNVKEIRDAVASMKDAGAPLEYAIELLKDDIASFEKAAGECLSDPPLPTTSNVNVDSRSASTDESIESDAILIRIIDDILDRVEENMAQLCKDREELREDLSAVELRLDAREMRVGARLFRA